MRVRFSLVSDRRLPEALVRHVRRTITDVCDAPDERPVPVPGLNALTWLFDLPEQLPEPFTGALSALRDELRGPAMALAVDSAFITGPMADHGPRAIVTDVDSTFITTEVIEMLAAYAGVEEEVRAVTESAMRGELDFKESLEHRVALLRGVPADVVDDVFAAIKLTPGARRLVDAAHARGAKFGLVSGGFTEVVGKIGADCQIDGYVANGLEVNDGVLTGRTYGPVIDGAAKVEAIERWQEEWDVSPDLTLCAGDGANDLPMLARAGLGVAFMGKQVVVERADCAISIPRLDAIAALVGWDIDG
ncbi:phosphoserine phosphatase SerB [Trueperella bialowiezensis]|uniref:phosphoserine phosphatase n=1 Tax=Trueperella bialowiezensis TaxID=312285 RepID=A0A3S4V583_9ACTO|nr:phosphoserine phosphatase SerB [Trueperella bialowiezensis]VEI12350.1 Phosphoserine phosphatase [Trueperella bialowiezensis]